MKNQIFQNLFKCILLQPLIPDSGERLLIVTVIVRRQLMARLGDREQLKKLMSMPVIKRNFGHFLYHLKALKEPFLFTLCMGP